jgi:hypothetical protein
VRPKGVIDGNHVNIRGPVGSDGHRMLSGLIGLPRQRRGSRKQLPHQTVPETDTGGLVENTKALERTMLKELGKLPS